MQGTDRTGQLGETAIQRDILDNLLWRNVFAWRTANIPVPIRRGRKIVGMRKADPHTRGQPDITAVIGGRYLGIEVKKWDGKQSDEQKLWEERVRKAGGIYLLARSWEDVAIALIEYGIEL